MGKISLLPVEQAKDTLYERIKLFKNDYDLKFSDDIYECPALAENSEDALDQLVYILRSIEKRP